MIERLKQIVGAENVLVGESLDEKYARDEALAVKPCMPEVVVKPQTTEEIAEILRLANEKRIPVTPRGGGTGLSGGCVTSSGGILLSLERMNRILEIDEENHVAVVEAGVTLSELFKAVEAHGLCYPIYPGEASATVGGNVATNAGGMMAIKYGVTRHFVLGLEAVLPTGEVIKTGGKYGKVSSGYDLTQLIVGSEGTLAVITKVILKLVPKQKAKITLFAAFRNLKNCVKTVPLLLKSGVTPLIVEFMDKLGLFGMENYTGIRVPINEPVREEAEAFLLIVLEGENQEQVYKNAEVVGDICMESGAMEVFVPSTERAQRELLELREKSFYAARDSGATFLVDVVVPRSEIPKFMEYVKEVSAKYSTVITGTGHAGDGNIHLAILEPDRNKLSSILKEIYLFGKALGGAISAEHGIGMEKRELFLELEDHVKIELMRRIKKAFDPNNILNPGKIF
ncbi:FAD-binding oxidoreductase [Candidatus Bathyarchaeota archaeon]|nr:FAD-binding oxidoreductase [Candidatus Bathyarchaeota archaeon]